MVHTMRNLPVLEGEFVVQGEESVPYLILFNGLGVFGVLGLVGVCL